MSNSANPCLQHATLPCSSLSPGVSSNLRPLSRWCHPTISFFVAPVSSCPQSFPTLGSFSMSWLFVSSGQSMRLIKLGRTSFQWSFSSRMTQQSENSRVLHASHWEGEVTPLDWDIDFKHEGDASLEGLMSGCKFLSLKCHFTYASSWWAHM